MRAGLLTDTITLQMRVLVRDEYGSETAQWADCWTGRANVQFARGSRKETHGEIVNAVERKIVMRGQVKVNAKMRVLHNGQAYRILTVDTRRSDMSTVLMCELINE